ncbi:serine hydrolase [Nonomuraea sp. NPDC050691]|uniref:serine hydrolase n=1 Tax=Nonomuraea sp. NPDC050691 TaxID=3155661 RepID=UPI0033FDABF7
MQWSRPGHGSAGGRRRRRFGGPAGLTRYFRSLKDPVSRIDRWHPALNDWTPKDRRDTTTPAAIAADLRLLALGDALHPDERKQFVAWLLANKTGANRIGAGLPKTWAIGDHTGTNSRRIRRWQRHRRHGLGLPKLRRAAK